MKNKQRKYPEPGKKNAALYRLIKSLQLTNAKELTCEEAFQFIDEYVELTLKGENTKELLPLVHHHLEMCRDCREEYETLKDLLAHLHEE